MKKPIAMALLIAAVNLTPLRAEPKFADTVRGKVTASWTGTADESGIGPAPTDGDIAALATYPAIEVIQMSGATSFTGKGFASLQHLPKLRELSMGGRGPGRISEMFPPGSLEGYGALAELALNAAKPGLRFHMVGGTGKP